jgi:uncharacterized coiled-coil protein SlyX
MPNDLAKVLSTHHDKLDDHTVAIKQLQSDRLATDDKLADVIEQVESLEKRMAAQERTTKALNDYTTALSEWTKKVSDWATKVREMM